MSCYSKAGGTKEPNQSKLSTTLWITFPKLRAGPMIITRKYIEAHKTKSGAWTDDQINALTGDQGKASGWKNRAIGTIISPENQLRFEAKRTPCEAKQFRNRDLLEDEAFEDVPYDELEDEPMETITFDELMGMSENPLLAMSYDELLAKRTEIIIEMSKRPEFTGGYNSGQFLFRST